MTNSRLATLKQARDHLAHGLRHNFKDLEERAVTMMNLLMDITSINPLPPSNRQYLPEMFFAQMYARDLIKDLPLFLIRRGALEDIYRITNDPSALGGCISWGLSASVDDSFHNELRDLLDQSLNLGGVLSSSLPVDARLLRDPKQARDELSFPSVDQAKKLLSNQIKNEWAVEPDVQNNRNYGMYLALLIGYICDNDPQWGLQFLLENDARLGEIIDTGYRSSQVPHLKSVVNCLPSTLTTKLLEELNRVVPEYYDELMRTRFMGGMLLNAVDSSPEFKISSLPPHESLMKPTLAALFSHCASMNTLTQERLDDLNQAWDKVATKGCLVRDSLKSAHFKSMATTMRNYSELIRTPGLTAEMLKDAIEDYRCVDSNWLLLDALKNKPGARIEDDPQAFANHCAFRLAATMVDVDFIERMPTTGTTLAIAVLELKNGTHYEEEAQALTRFVSAAFEDKANYGEIAKLTEDQLDAALDQLPDFDRSVLRKINWVDRSIKARMLEQDLGM